jgi:hypothetical protein
VKSGQVCQKVWPLPNTPEDLSLVMQVSYKPKKYHKLWLSGFLSPGTLKSPKIWFKKILHVQEFNVKDLCSMPFI